MKPLLNLFLALALLMGFASAAETSRFPEPPPLPQALVARIGASAVARGAYQTHQNVINAANKLGKPVDYKAEIPREFWAPAIGELNPLSVSYLGGVNIAAVITRTPQYEEGIYIVLMISSSAPKEAPPAFTSTHLAKGGVGEIYTFQRQLKPDPVKTEAVAADPRTARPAETAPAPAGALSHGGFPLPPQETPEQRVARVGMDAVVSGSLQTHVNASNAARSRGERLNYNASIPRECWAPGIRDLNPVSVFFISGGNVAAVLNRTATEEEGIFIVRLVSSTAPPRPSATFTSKKIGDGGTDPPFSGQIFSFRRKIETIPFRIEAAAVSPRTARLAEEVLPRFAMKAGLCSDSEPIRILAFTRRNFPQFEEFARQPDLWRGILHAYVVFGEEIRITSDTAAFGNASMTLSQFKLIYQMPEFQAQLKGREELFLQANLFILKRFMTCAEQTIKEGRAEQLFGEPVWAATALELAKEIDPATYSSISPGIEKYKFSPGQKSAELRDYLKLLIGGLEQIKPGGKMRR